MRRADHHNEIELNLIERGWLVYLLGSERVRFEAGRLGVFWAAIPHQILAYAPGTKYFVATIPLAWFLQCRPPDRLAQPLLQGAALRETGSEGSAFDVGLFSRWEIDLRNGNEEFKNIALLEMEARLRRLALRLPQIDCRSPKQRRGNKNVGFGRLNKVEQMACLIARGYTERLAVEDISRNVGLNPNYAMGLFKKTFGTTLIDYITRHRVSHAQRLLATSGDKIVDVAFSSGFSSISRFNEAFRRVCGCSPREYRSRHEFGP